MKVVVWGINSRFAEILWSEQLRILLVGRSWLVGYLILTTGAYSYLDNFYYDENMAYVWLGFLAWALEYLLLVKLMSLCALFDQGRSGGVGTYFVAGLIKSSAVGVGLVALVLPGLYLLMRWMPVYPRCLTAEAWIGGTFRWSWDATEPYQRELAGALVIPLAIMSVGFALPEVYELVGWDSMFAYVVATLIINVSMSVGLAWLTVLGIASYTAIIRCNDAKLEQNPA